MEIELKEIRSKGVKLFVSQDGQEVARAYLYIMNNDLHQEPFGLMEDIFVNDALRGKGIGTKLVEALIDKARGEGCYKLVAYSRYSNGQVHKLYQRLGFIDHGKEFRINF